MVDRENQQIPPMTARTAAAILLALLTTTPATADCTTPAESPIASTRALVDRTAAIVVGDVVSVEVKAGKRRYSVNVVERLKGAAPAALTVSLPFLPGETPQTLARRFPEPKDYIDHYGANFWLWKTRAQAPLATCFWPQDLRRGRHVIFLGWPYHANSFEAIQGPADPWLATVKRMIADPAVTGRAVGPVAFARMFDAVYRFQCRDYGVAGKERCSQPRRKWGWPVIDWQRRTASPKISPGACPPTANAECTTHWMFVAAPFTFIAKAAPSPTGRTVTFEKQYGELVLTKTEIDERELIEALRW